MKKGTKNKSLFFKILAWLAVPIGVVPGFTTNKFWFGIILSISLFIILFWLVILAYRAYQCYRKYSRKKEMLLKQCKNKKSDYPYSLYSLKAHIRKLFFEQYFCIIGKRLSVFAVIVIVACINNNDNAKAYYNNLKALVGIENKKEDSVQRIKEDSDLEEGKQKEDDFSESQEKERKNANWRFIIDNQDESEFSDLEREQQVFFYCPNEGVKWESYVLSCMEDLYEEERKGVDYKLIQDANGNDFYTYTELEDRFKEKVEEISDYQYFDDWLKVAPHSTELDYYIFGREHLNQIDYEGETGCYKIWNQLANDYQYYAEEYERQTNNESAVSYYYINSIYCCMQGLKYSVSKGDKDKLYHYMVMRYHDMADEQLKVSDEVRKKASKIYSLLVKADCLSIIDK